MMRPIGNRAMVKLEDGKLKSPGGIEIPEAVRNGAGIRRGRVLAVGKGLVSITGDRIPLDVLVGDHIMFRYKRDVTLLVKDDAGESFLMVDEGDIVSVID